MTNYKKIKLKLNNETNKKMKKIYLKLLNWTWKKICIRKRAAKKESRKALE